MKTKARIIILSGLVSFALLTLTGCGSNGERSVQTQNPVIPDNPVAVIPVIPVEPIPTPDPYKTAGWYGKTQVSATASDGKVYKHESAGVFGELVQSDDAKDQHDIPGYGSAILQVVFPQTQWGEDNGDYFSDYQYFDEEGDAKRVWTFQVKNQHTVNLSNAPITIHLDGIYDVSYIEKEGQVEYKESKDINQTLLSTLHLVDVDNQTEYTIDELKTATLTMDGLHTRTFRWVMGIVEQDDYLPLSKTAELSVAKMDVYSAENAAEASDFNLKSERQSAGGKFGLPPQ